MADKIINISKDVISAAGGIVVQRGEPPLFAVVCLRKRGDWVLPKGKLDPGETPRAAAQREVLEETGHDTVVGEFLGTLAYEVGLRIKVVHYWRMEADAEPSRSLMKDITEVEWLPLDEALARLTRSHEQAFLAQVGPLALQARAGVRGNGPTGTPPAGLLQKLRRWLKG
ncbi:NUDIX hydrolase [Tardiphaga sp. vice352]|uniref:NUDIX hydrolase n=1 Tax=unclassified Tardiphaga TaxID=2631404 RepID=UPI00116245BA|nr:NUDIX hydrolase [Tardiphaga sp. vice278]QDM24016.1 NUDIX hydrolase [Tardiphaga sp. vice154]QDM29239.1 NUDIX hydrolase [Tardiphaga sp. vice304]QDM34339.1 NUDIX hydrolase [Tardiphaga sp. vice352]